MLRFLTIAILALAGCVQDRQAARTRSPGSSAPLSVIISNQCAVLRVPSGYIAVFVFKDSPSIYYGAYFSTESRFGWLRPTADGIVEGDGMITVQGVKLQLRSVGEFTAEVALLESDDGVAGIALGQAGWGVGDVRADQLTFRTKRGWENNEGLNRR